MIELDAAIIGGAFSGCAVAAQLARQARGTFTVALFEAAELGRGAAYGTRHDAHLLNTRANAMSLFPDDPEHFVRWLGGRAQPDDFVPRRIYGDYVADVARRAFARPGFTVVADRAVRVRRRPAGGFEVDSAADIHFGARAVVLATGNPLPAAGALPPAARLHPGYIGDPWRFDYRSVGGHVLIVGSGLTALDVLVALDACGHRGRIDMVSRHGQYPQTHAPGMPYDVIPAIDTADARAALRSFRRHVAQARRRGFDWRAVVDAVRPEAEATWRRLAPAEQRRFERHLRRRWERHRHRAPAQVDAVLRRYEASGRFNHHVGRLVGVAGGEALLRLTGGQTARLRPDWIVNCSGTGGVDAMATDAIVRELLAQGAISAHAARMGLRVGPNFEAVGAGECPTPGLWIVGPPVRGSRFEATAVPEIRGMAERVAAAVLEAAEPHVRFA